MDWEAREVLRTNNVRRTASSTYIRFPFLKFVAVLRRKRGKHVASSKALPGYWCAPRIETLQVSTKGAPDPRSKISVSPKWQKGGVVCHKDDRLAPSTRALHVENTPSNHKTTRSVIGPPSWAGFIQTVSNPHKRALSSCLEIA